MKKILIIGRNSYIGKNFKKYLEVSPEKPEEFVVDAVSGESGEWKSVDFSDYDAIIMCSALVHKKEKKLGLQAYLAANTQLPTEIAKKAKEQGVKQFVFLSSLAVYGRGYEAIDASCKPQPETFYGKSKLLAEEALLQMQSPNFGITILRPPTVYGRRAKGSYQSLRKWTRLFPFFPKIENQKSVISIRQLCRFLEGCITEEKPGLFHPQDKEYCSTSVLAQKAGRDVQRTVLLLPFPRCLHRFLKKHCKYWRKVFGDLVVVPETDSKK